jgi:hypothetical protein
MNTLLSRLLAVFALIVGSPIAAESKPPTFVPASGLQLSLDTGGFRFVVGEPVPPVATANALAAKVGALLPTNGGFAARVALANTSRAAIPFEFNDSGAASVKFQFSVRAPSGALVWQSDTDLISAQVITPATLGKGERWKRVMQIPLKVDGTWLAPGRYTLTATLAGAPAVSAQTIFEVADVILPPAGSSGIRGLVLIGPVSPVTTAGQSNEKPLAGALVTITEIQRPDVYYIRGPWTWNVTTDQDGKFAQVTPPGRYRLTASTPPTTTRNEASVILLPKVPGGSGQAEVTVAPGLFSEVILHVDSGIR